MSRRAWGVAFGAVLVALVGTPLLPQELLRIERPYFCAAEAGPIPSEVFAFDPTQAAAATLREILKTVELGTTGIELKAADVENAAAYLDPLSRRRLILYNEDFVRNLESRSTSFWTARAILAHEVAHHANSHLELTDPERRKQQELEADKFAGAVLFRLGASEEAAVKVFESFREGEAYPRRQARVAAAKSGWWSAAEQSGYDPSATRGEREGGQPETGSEWPIMVEEAPPAGPSIANFYLTYEHRASVPHTGGGLAAPGLQFRANGQLTLGRSADLQLVLYFTFPDGTWLFANAQEQHYRAGGNQIATGSDHVVVDGAIDLDTVFIKPIPYYALNLVPTGYQTTYLVMAQAIVFVDGATMGQSAPVQFAVQW